MGELEKENRRLQAKVHSLSNANDTLQRKLFEYDEMHNRLVTALGFSNVTEAMNSIIAESQHNHNPKEVMDQSETIQRLEDALAIQLEAVEAAETSIHSISAELHQTRQELSQALEDIERVRNERCIARNEAERHAADARAWRMELETKLPEMQSILRNMKQTYPEGEPSVDKTPIALRTGIPDASASETTIKDQYEQLKKQFEVLSASKSKLAEKYQQDILKWKRFKKWVVKGETTNDGTRDQKLVIRRKRSNREMQHSESENIPETVVADQHPRVIPVPQKHLEESLTQQSEFPTSQTIHGILPSPVSRKKPLALSSPSYSDDASSIGGAGSDHLSNPFSKKFDSIGDDDSRLEDVLVQSAPTRPCPSMSDEGEDVSNGPILYAEVCEESSPLKEAASSIILVPDTPPSNTLFPSSHASCTPGSSRQAEQVLKSNSKGPNPILTSTTKTVPSADKNAKQNDGNLSRYAQYKGRGRYSNAKEYRDVISNAFELDYNDDNRTDESTRNKDRRKMLKGVDCECCRDYYETLRPLPAGLARPLWRSPSTKTSPQRRCLHQMDKRLPYQTEAHRNEISRHRVDSDKAITPPNFWKIGFPNTQEVEDINRRADDMHARKFQRIAEESKSNKKKIQR